MNRNIEEFSGLGKLILASIAPTLTGLTFGSLAAGTMVLCEGLFYGAAKTAEYLEKYCRFNIEGQFPPEIDYF
ncbi:MAG: hypothetical protein Q8L27_04135 [archaeon]|nr:hypothetical protein [archaeon]